MNTSTTDNDSTTDHKDRLRVGPAKYTQGGYIPLRPLRIG